VALNSPYHTTTDEAVVERTGLLQLVYQPTRGNSKLDRVFVSWPMYNTVRVVTSTLRSDHKAIVAYNGKPELNCKTSTKKVFRPTSPTQHAVFLQYISALGSANNADEHWRDVDTQDDFDEFYNVALNLLNHFYPQRTVTVTSRDPQYITPAIKAKLRRKNRLRRAGRVEAADALAVQIGKDIAKRNKMRLSKIDHRTNSKDMWAAVRQLTGRRQNIDVADGITAESLNEHYARISTDTGYQVPLRKHTVTQPSAGVRKWYLNGKFSQASQHCDRSR